MPYVKQFFTNTTVYLLIGIAIVTASSMYDLFYGTDLSHPLWNKTYPWGELFKQIALVAVAGGALQVLASSLAPTINSVLFKIYVATIGGFMAEKNMRFYQARLAALERARTDIAKKIERSYLRDNIVEYLALEARYEKVIRSMQRIRALIKRAQVAA